MYLYRRGPGLFSGAVVVEAGHLIQGRLKAAIKGLDLGFACEGPVLHEAAREKIPPEMTDRKPTQ